MFFKKKKNYFLLLYKENTENMKKDTCNPLYL